MPADAQHLCESLEEVIHSLEKDAEKQLLEKEIMNKNDEYAQKMYDAEK